jgi:signal transduction histidine kinase
VHRHVRADGGEFNVEVSAAPFTIDADGQSQLLTVEVIRDLSQDLRLSQEQRLAEIGYLAAGVAHEIHNPLASIHLGLESINRELADGRVEKANQYIRVIDQQIGRCIEVTSRLLRLSAAPSDVPDLVVLNEVVFDVLSLLSAEAIASNVTVEQEMAENLRVIASDSEMRMMVLNIAQNAVHAMPDGGQLTVRGIRQGDMLEITIEDTGVGIAPDDLARIFDPFWSRRADGVHGTGLGLPICREILKRAGGQIAVSSEIGKGTRFIITLPSADRQVHAS